MTEQELQIGAVARIEREDLQSLFDALRAEGYQPIAPTVREGAIVYDAVQSVDDLPAGSTDEQAPGSYRLVPRDDESVFGYVVGPQSWKRFLHPPEVRLWSAQRHEGGFTVTVDDAPPPHYAFIGVRGCELSAIAIQDRVFLQGEHQDRTYSQRRETAFLVAVNCVESGSSCFCTSLDTGPRVGEGFDIALTEIVSDQAHYFLAEVGSDRGAVVLAQTRCTAADSEEIAVGVEAVQRAADSIERRLDTDGIRNLLYGQLDHPRWESIASRCLACGNCTMVCPTCFCTTVEDVTDLTGDHAERWRKWDSCFTMDFSYLHGGSMRRSTASRYRQWMTHKLAGWQDQFGLIGCVGCGRCITWCPVGIDITAEAQAFRELETAAADSDRR